MTEPSRSWCSAPAAPGWRGAWPSAPGGAGHAPECAACEAEVRFGSGAHLRALFRDRVPIVGVCAGGILVRALAPLLGDKRDEPPVLAVAEDGSAVVPLLGGHRGANRLARRLAEVLGCAPAVTTAGDAALGLALDEPPDGWVLANPEAAKGVAVRCWRAGRRGSRSTRGSTRRGWCGAAEAPSPAPLLARRGGQRRRETACSTTRASSRSGSAASVGPSRRRSRLRPRRPGRGRRQPARRRLRRLGRPEGCRARGPCAGRKP